MIVETETNLAQVRRILQSKALRTSEVHRNLLMYLAEKSLSGEADALKEYTVGLDVFAKPDSYDPRQESVVRMHMARLRQKLAEYYRTEGLTDPIIVDLPKGAFKVTFEPRPAAVAPETAPALVTVAVSAPPGSRRILVVLVALIVVAVACASYFGLRLLQVERTAAVLTPPPAAWTPDLQELWAPLLAQDRPLVVVLATQQSRNLTGVSTASGAFQLGQFLADRKPNAYVISSDELSMPDIMMGNLIFLGPTSGNRQLQALPLKEELALEPQGIRNLHPKNGEPAFFPSPPPRAANSTVDESYALITHAPGVHGKGDVLYLSGTHAFSPAAGVEALTDPSLASSIVVRMRKPDGKLPRYYQILLAVKSMDDTPIEIIYRLHKELTGTAR
jgi:hypothetical protein